jgi:tetratricopeptide (TPR) repeat protein
MRHIPFLQALADASGADDPVWRDASAGYLVLRFFDRWLEEGPARMSADTGLQGLRERIRSVQDVEPRVRNTLLKAIQEMVDAEEANPAVVLESLLEYGRYLEMAGRLELAAHIYQTMIDVLDSSGCSDPLSAATARMRYGLVMRLLGDFDTSSDSYQRAEHLAEQACNFVLVLRARVGMANTLRARGNLGDAESLLDRVVVDASQESLVNAESIALHSRGGIREIRGRRNEAMEDFFRAYKLANDTSERERILGDLAACAGKAGYHQMARNAHRVLAYTTNDPFIRSSALMNLLELAVWEGNATEFERLQGQIQIHAEQHPLPAEYAIHTALYRAYGIERFGLQEDAIAAYRDVITQANNTGLYHVAFEAEKNLTALLAGAMAHDDQPSYDPPHTLRHIADTIAEWETLALSAS